MTFQFRQLTRALVVLFVCGILFRLWLINLVPQPLYIGDQYDYQHFAFGILQNGLAAHSARLYGYPLFLAIVYLIGGQAPQALFIAQALLDTFCGVLLFILASHLFQKKWLSWMVYILYLVNPFTSNFVGLALTEVLSVFIVSSILILLYAFLKKGSVWVGTALFFLFGFLIQVRPPFIFFSLVLFLVGVIFLVRKSRERLFYSFIYIVPFLYTVIGNLLFFQTFSPLTIDNIFVRELYISLFVGRSPAHDTKLILDNHLYMFPNQVKDIYRDYSPLTMNTPQLRKEIANRYLKLSLEEIAGNPVKFVTGHLAKMWYVWEKQFIFYYFQPANTVLDVLTRWGNIVLLVLGVYGLVSWFKKQLAARNNTNVYFASASLFLLFYITVLHVFSLSEQRYSLPGYPVIFLFAPYGILQLRIFLHRHT